MTKKIEGEKEVKNLYEGSKSNQISAYLVLGPESSGTRLVTRILLEAGCNGSDDHVQPWDDTPFPEPTNPIVFRRSIPHAKTWPNIPSIIRSIREKGYNIQAVVTARDWYAVSKSQSYQKQHVNDQDEAYKNLQQVYPFIFKALEQEKVPYIMVTYESIVNNNKAINEFLTYASLPNINNIDLDKINLYNGNSKWFNTNKSNKEGNEIKLSQKRSNKFNWWNLLR